MNPRLILVAGPCEHVTRASRLRCGCAPPGARGGARRPGRGLGRPGGVAGSRGPVAGRSGEGLGGPGEVARSSDGAAGRSAGARTVGRRARAVGERCRDRRRRAEGGPDAARQQPGHLGRRSNRTLQLALLRRLPRPLLAGALRLACARLGYSGAPCWLAAGAGRALRRSVPLPRPRVRRVATDTTHVLHGNRRDELGRWSW